MQKSNESDEENENNTTDKQAIPSNESARRAA